MHLFVRMGALQEGYNTNQNFKTNFLLYEQKVLFRIILGRWVQK